MKRNEIDITALLFGGGHQPTEREQLLSELVAKAGVHGLRSYDHMQCAFNAKYGSGFKVAAYTPMQSLNHYQHEERVMTKWLKLKLYSTR